MGVREDRFSIREAYSLLSPMIGSVFPAKGVWISNSPKKSVFFTWEAILGMVITLDKL